MFTPQQIDQISFSRSTFGGYDMQQVDEFLEPLTEDYVTLYKENALLKSKMRVLVGKLEEYRKSEASMKEAVANAQKAADKMMLEAEAKCAQMLNQAKAAAANVQPAAPVVDNTKAEEARKAVAAENERVEEARRAAAAKINDLQEQLRSCIQALDRIKSANAPAAPVKPEQPKAAFDFDSDDVASEISKNLESLVGTTDDVAPKAEPKHPVNDTTTSKFSTLNLQFGRNYGLNK